MLLLALRLVAGAYKQRVRATGPKHKVHPKAVSPDTFPLPFASLASLRLPHFMKCQCMGLSTFEVYAFEGFGFSCL